MAGWRAWGRRTAAAGGRAAAGEPRDGRGAEEPADAAGPIAGKGPIAGRKASARRKAGGEVPGAEGAGGGGPEREEPGAGAPPAEPDPRAKAAAPARRGPGRFVRVLVALVALAGMVAFAVVLARLTLAASPASVPLTHSNLTPGRSIGNYLDQPGFVDTVRQLGGNILLGVPFGILLPLLSRKARGFVRVALITGGTMLLVELVQGALVTGRAFDVDDVLLNTTGALLGYVLVGRRLGRYVHPRTRPRWWQRGRVGDPTV
ncbi:VanZ family protein [Streptomyces omiyaensis]|uniref:VanZ family protein n=1 Tax=Streptomyces omiyaensis TaxID=68247 RepID=UPI0037029869